MTVAVRHRDRDPLLRQCCDEGPCTHAWCGLAGLFALYFIAFGKAAHHLCSLAGSFAWGLRARARLPRLHLLLTRSRFACLEEDAMCSQGRPVAAQDTRSRVAAFSGGCWPAAGCGDRHHAARWHRGPCTYYVHVQQHGRQHAATRLACSRGRRLCCGVGCWPFLPEQAPTCLCSVPQADCAAAVMDLVCGCMIPMQTASI